ncbi:MAG: 4-hydroxy-3-methylbut-2-enyl diphosphate reductase [Nocardioidaceae bacterium]
MTDPQATVCTPLRIEQAALRGRTATPVVRTGRGPGGRVGRRGPALVVGVAGGLSDRVSPGDLVVADQVTGDGTAVDCHVAPLLVGALRRAGLTVHEGTICSTDHVVAGAERAELARSGALAVDTESAYLGREVPDGQLAVLRAVVDTAAHPLRRPGTARRGIQALRSLRLAAPVIDQWAAAVGERDVILAAPRSFCAGVERAIEVVERALQIHGSPVYVRRQIVHNIHVVRDLERRGAVFVEEVDEVPDGSVLVFAAHGVSPSVRAAAAARDLQVIDATCPLVSKVHTEVRRFASRDATVFLIGHHDHEEVVGTRGEAPEHVTVVANAKEAARVQVRDPSKVAYVMQTTLAVDEAEQTAAVLRSRFPTLNAPRRDDICYATTNRQQAVRTVARESDLLLVVGSPNSSNSHRLVEVAVGEGVEAHLIDDAGDIDLAWLAGRRRIGVTAGASAPPALVDGLVRCLSGLGPVRVRETSVIEENVQFTLPREVV